MKGSKTIILRYIIMLLVFAVLTAGLVVFFSSREAVVYTAPPKPVEVIKPEIRTIDSAIDTTGYIEASAMIPVVPFVQGTIEKYNIDAAVGTQLLSEGKYDEAREAYGAAYNAYSPRITVLFVASKHKRFIRSLESQIDTDVAEGIEQIKAFRAANRGRFDKTSEALLFRLLQLRPENEELMSLKEEWLQQ